MKTKKTLTTGRGVDEKQYVCGFCFAWIEYYDNFCWDCGAELVDKLDQEQNDEK